MLYRRKIKGLIARIWSRYAHLPLRKAPPTALTAVPPFLHSERVFHFATRVLLLTEASLLLHRKIPNRRIPLMRPNWACSRICTPARLHPICCSLHIRQL